MSNDKLETITAEYWQKRWSQNEIGWQRDAVHKFLVKYVDELTDYRSNLRVFVPLCGKSLDMLWLADQGHHVVGVDFVKHPIESFFEENNLTFRKLCKVKLAAACEAIDVYKCEEKQITIFCCDLFALTVEDVGGKFDAIWDRSSLSAVLPQVGDRGKRYTKHMRSFLTDKGGYMVESHRYNVDCGGLPPACIPEELMKEIYGDHFIIKELDVEKFAKDPKRSSFAFEYSLHYHLLKPKTK